MKRKAQPWGEHPKQEECLSAGSSYTSIAPTSVLSQKFFSWDIAIRLNIGTCSHSPSPLTYISFLHYEVAVFSATSTPQLPRASRKVKLGSLLTKLSVPGFVSETSVLLASSLKQNITSFQFFDAVLKHIRKTILYNSKCLYYGVTERLGS